MFDAIVITGGNIQRDFALAFLKNTPYRFLAVADGGLKFCQEQRLVPDLAVGDFDSVPQTLVDVFQEKKTEIIRLCPEKDDSDTQSLLNHLLKRGLTSCAILGGTGTRMDHVFANLELLVYAHTKGMRAVLYDENNCIFVAQKKEILRKDSQFGKYVSLFPMGGCVTGLSLQGFYYPLEKAALGVLDCGLTVSNEIVEQEAVIQYETGTLLLFQTRD